MIGDYSKPFRVDDEDAPEENRKSHIAYLIRSVPRGICFPYVVLDRGGVFDFDE